MDFFEAALGQVVDYMLYQKNCQVENAGAREMLLMQMRQRLRDIATMTAQGAMHAGRSAPCYFDVERTFRLLRINPSELKALRDEPMNQAVVKFNPQELHDEDLHQTPDLDLNQQRAVRSGRHIPKYMPPFPSVHTYQNTKMEMLSQRDHTTERELHAEQQLGTQKALNSYYLRTQPSLSLFTEPQNDTQFMVLSVDLPQKPAFLEALMPQSDVFDVDVYEFDEPPNENAQGNPFLKEPQLESILPFAEGSLEIDLGFNTNEPTEETEEEAEGQAKGQAKGQAEEQDEEMPEEQDEEMPEEQGEEMAEEQAEKMAEEMAEEQEEEMEEEQSEEQKEEESEEEQAEKPKVHPMIWELPDLND